MHTPEFAFEHVVSNVRASGRSSASYPVAIDDNYDTWNAYDNEYWPAEYLIDATGPVRHVHFGEGEYAETESLIRQSARRRPPDVSPAAAQRPPRPHTGRADQPGDLSGLPAGCSTWSGGVPVPDKASGYRFPGSLDPGAFALSGTWTVGADQVTAGPGARLELGFQAKDVYLVLGGSGTVTVAVNGAPAKTVVVGGVPRLYTLVSTPGLGSGVLTLGMSPGIEAYDFTFG